MSALLIAVRGRACKIPVALNCLLDRKRRNPLRLIPFRHENNSGAMLVAAEPENGVRALRDAKTRADTELHERAANSLERKSVSAIKENLGRFIVKDPEISVNGDHSENDV